MNLSNTNSSLLQSVTCMAFFVFSRLSALVLRYLSAFIDLFANNKSLLALYITLHMEWASCLFRFCIGCRSKSLRTWRQTRNE